MRTPRVCTRHEWGSATAWQQDLLAVLWCAHICFCTAASNNLLASRFAHYLRCIHALVARTPLVGSWEGGLHQEDGSCPLFDDGGRELAAFPDFSKIRREIECQPRLLDGLAAHHHQPCVHPWNSTIAHHHKL